ncbi:MAG: hypothetical protein Cons2KO_24890 [Congregibacter sp.]
MGLKLGVSVVCGESAADAAKAVAASESARQLVSDFNTWFGTRIFDTVLSTML